MEDKIDATLGTIGVTGTTTWLMHLKSYVTHQELLGLLTGLTGMLSGDEQGTRTP